MGVSAAAANAFIKQHNVIYFNSHLGFGFLFFFSMQFLSGMNSSYCSFWRGNSRKLVTEEKENEEPGDSPGHFLQKCVSRQSRTKQRGRVSLRSTFTKVSGWRGQKHHVWPFSAETLPHPWPNRKVKGESLRRHIHTLISKALLLFFGLFVPSLFTF